jgi:DNA primase
VSGIPEEVIEQVRDAADIVAVIGEHVDLRKTGADYRGPCPLHGGANRNFSVIPRKQMFYCFVCHEGGDVFTFYMKRFGMDYPSAVREIARKVGIAIPDRPSGGPDPREPLYSAVAVAADWYARYLRDAGDARAAREYLQSRGFDLERLLPHGLGFAPKGDEFLAAMETFGIAQDVLLNAGLAVTREDGSVRPRFWNRLLFPIHDLRGRAVGFGGRVLGDQEPKYLNSPDSEIFHKRTLLYHLNESKHAIRKAERAVVVEGYFDVLRLAEAGIEEVIAPLGTAFTSDQARLLKRYTKDVILLFDSDAPGMRASFRSADELLRQGLRVQLATLPAGEDPDTLAQRGGAAAVEAVISDALDVLERKIQLLERKGWLGTVSGRRRALDRILPTIRAAADPVTKDIYIGRTAEALGVSASVVAREVEASPRTPASPASSASPAGGVRVGRSSPERDLIRAMLKEPRWRARVGEQLGALGIERQPEREVLEVVSGAGTELSGADLVHHVEGQARDYLLQQIEALDDWSPPNLDDVVESAIRKIQSRTLVERGRRLDRDIAVASETDKIAMLKDKQALVQQKRDLGTADWKVIYKNRSS